MVLGSDDFRMIIIIGVFFLNATLIDIVGSFQSNDIDFSAAPMDSLMFIQTGFHDFVCTFFCHISSHIFVLSLPPKTFLRSIKKKDRTICCKYMRYNYETCTKQGIIAALSSCGFVYAVVTVSPGTKKTLAVGFISSIGFLIPMRIAAVVLELALDEVMSVDTCLCLCLCVCVCVFIVYSSVYPSKTFPFGGIVCLLDFFFWLFLYPGYMSRLVLFCFVVFCNFRTNLKI